MTPATPPTPDPPRTRWGRRSVVQGAMLLLLAFFLPVIRGCSEEIVPLEQVSSTLATDVFEPELTDSYLLDGQDPWPAFRSLAIFILPFWSGLLCLVRYACEERGRPDLGHRVLHYHLVACLVCFELGYMAEFVKVLGRRGAPAFWSQEFAAALAPLPAVALFVGLQAFARTRRMAALHCQIILGLAITGFLGTYLVLILRGFFGFDLRPGIFVALAGGVLIAAGSVLEWLDERAATPTGKMR